MDYQPVDIYCYSNLTVEFNDKCRIIRPTNETMAQFFNLAIESRSPLICFWPNDIDIQDQDCLKRVWFYLFKIYKYVPIAKAYCANPSVVWNRSKESYGPLFIKRQQLIEMAENDTLISYFHKYPLHLNIPIVMSKHG